MSETPRRRSFQFSLARLMGTVSLLCVAFVMPVDENHDMLVIIAGVVSYWILAGAAIGSLFKRPLSGGLAGGILLMTGVVARIIWDIAYR